MKRAHTDRIVGVETEFGCLVRSENLGTNEEVVNLIKDTVFFDQKLGLLDMHARDDVFEPAFSGGFLRNGGRLYVDAVGSHLEYATAECIQIKDLVANDRAGQRIVTEALKYASLEDEVAFYNNSIDHFGGHTFGCHENYLVGEYETLLNDRLELFLPFLITRQIFAGAGRVGGHILSDRHFRPTEDEVYNNFVDYIWVSSVYGVVPDPQVDFQLSQRADHILKTIASRVRFNRSMINPKWDHYYTHEGRTRLHLLFGEANQMQYAYALKIGTTSLVLSLLEDNIIPPGLYLSKPIVSLRHISRDSTRKWMIELEDGRSMSAIDLQRIYLKFAQRYRDDSEQTNWILTEWEATLDQLEADPMILADRIDWVAKLSIVNQYRESEGLTWQDDALHSVDLEYHNLDSEQSLHTAWDQVTPCQKIASEMDILDAMSVPPQNTRAKLRADLIEQLLAENRRPPYSIDWSRVTIQHASGPFADYYSMPDPFVFTWNQEGQS